MSGFENFAKVTAVVSALGGATEGVQAQEVVDDGMKNIIMHEVLPVLEEGDMKKIGDGKFTMEHNGVVLEITIPQYTAEVRELAETIDVEEKTETIQVNEQKVIVGTPKL
jgi:hypothetical protein